MAAAQGGGGGGGMSPQDMMAAAAAMQQYGYAGQGAYGQGMMPGGAMMAPMPGQR